MMRCALLLTAVVVLLAGPSAGHAAPVCGEVPDTMIVLDRSGSMQDSIGFLQSKWSVAKDAVNNLTGGFAGQLGFGLMLFPLPLSSCSAGTVNVAPGPNTAAAIGSAMQASFPQGNTPIAGTLSNARNYLLAHSSGKAQYVILVTDGMETCSGNPVSATSALSAAGIKTYVVGFGSAVDPGTLQSMAQVGGTGNYFQADNLAQLNTALQAIANQISCCGNGQLDNGEQCDKAIPFGSAGACPSSCNDGNACTTDQLEGSECNTHCTFTPITAPAHNDGCCPPGATNDVDNDCPNLCGNGQLDAGEDCDTAIAVGQPGSCPVSCDDGDPCSGDLLEGSGCHAVCTHTATCAELCGNGVIDTGEKCDTAIPAGQQGACPTSCDNGDPCSTGTVEGQGCNASCTFGPTPPKLEGSDSCCPEGHSSLTDPDCPPPCGPDRTDNCVDLCGGVTCPDGQYCHNGSCAPWPTSENPGGGEEDPSGQSNNAETPTSAGGGANVVGGCAVVGGDGSAGLLWLLAAAMLLARRRQRRPRR